MSTFNDFFKKTSFSTNKINPVNDLKGEKFWIKPSAIVRDSISIPYETFLSSFGSWEGEAMAYQICRFFAENGDQWYPVSIKKLSDYVAKAHEELKDRVKNFSNRADYAVLIGSKITFTNRFIERCAGFRALHELERHKVSNVFQLN